MTIDMTFERRMEIMNERILEAEKRAENAEKRADTDKERADKLQLRADVAKQQNGTNQ